MATSLACHRLKVLIVAEAKVIETAQIATNIGAILGILFIAVGLGMELLGRKKVGE